MQGAIETGIQVIKLLGIVAFIEFLIILIYVPIKLRIQKAILNRKIKKFAKEYQIWAKEIVQENENKEEK